LLNSGNKVIEIEDFYPSPLNKSSKTCTHVETKKRYSKDSGLSFEIYKSINSAKKHILLGTKED